MASENDHAGYEIKLLKEQVAMLERALNEARQQLGLPPINLPRSAYEGAR